MDHLCNLASESIHSVSKYCLQVCNRGGFRQHEIIWGQLPVTVLAEEGGQKVHVVITEWLLAGYKLVLNLVR